MRTTLTIPNEFYERIKLMLISKGFTSVNDYLLDLLRHQIDVKEGSVPQKIDIPISDIKKNLIEGTEKVETHSNEESKVGDINLPEPKEDIITSGRLTKAYFGATGKKRVL